MTTIILFLLGGKNFMKIIGYILLAVGFAAVGLLLAVNWSAVSNVITAAFEAVKNAL